MLLYSNLISLFRRADPGAVRGGRREGDEPDGDGAVQAAAVPHQQARQDGAEGGAHARQGSGTAATRALLNMLYFTMNRVRLGKQLPASITFGETTAELVKINDAYQNKHILHERVLRTRVFKDVIKAM